MQLLKGTAHAESREEMTEELRAPMRCGARVLLIAALSIQAAHLTMHLIWALPVVLSDSTLVVAAGISATVCFYKSRQEREYRRLWVKLGIAFLTWTAAQILWVVAETHLAVISLSLSELLWLIYAFPMLLVALHMPQRSRRDLANWFDVAQACIFFVILMALFFPAPGIISQAISDDVQSVALLLVLVLRYCMTVPGRDRTFFRNLMIYMGAYVALCIVYYAAVNHGLVTGSIAEVCWSIPFTVFSVVALRTDLSGVEKRRVEAEESYRSRLAQASYIQGISALGLAVLSLTGSAVLAYHKHVLGGIALGVTFALFAARAIARERQLNSLHSRLNHAVLHDPLTAVANRTLLREELARRLARTSYTLEADSRSGRSTAVLFLGLDRFKTLNDCLGHAFGDLLLQRVARLLTENVRAQDLVARYGGDEFVILLDAADTPEAETFAELILGMLRIPLNLEGRLLHITASVGLVAGPNDDNAATMLQDAHVAMHQAKKSGKDRVQAFDAEMVRGPLYRLGVETDLRAALENDEIVPFYQPIFSVDSGEVRGFEALARWTHKERGSVSPGDFIPIAEDTGLIVELGAQMLWKACRQCQEWNERFETAYTMNVNVSGHQFASPHLLKQVVSVLRETELDPRLLRLEITESVLLTGHSSVQETLEKARKMGIQICLDDFGTGFSSLSYLLKYPFDVVKIDQSFVRNLDEDRRKANVVRMLVDLASSLNKQLVAEGVERPEEIACLRDLGCELMQGYLPSRPMSAERVTQFLEERLARQWGGTLGSRGSIERVA